MRRPRALFALMLPAILVLSLLGGCELAPSSDDDSTTTATPDSTDTATTQTTPIGALLPLTGSLAATGTYQQAALEAALRDVNLNLANAGSARRLKLVTRDTASAAATALSALKDLVAQGVRLAVGPASSAECQAVRDYAKEQGVTLVSPSATLTALAQENDTLLRLVPSSGYQAEGTAQLLTKEPVEALASPPGVAHAAHTAAKTVLLPVWRDDPWAKEFADLVVASFTGTAVYGLSYAEGDYANLLKALDARVAKLIAPPADAAKVAILLVSFNECLEIMAQADDSASYPNLAKVAWYGAEGCTNSPALLQNAKAAHFAAQVGYTSSIFSLRDEVVNTPKTVLTDRSLREGIEAQAGRDLPDDSFAAYDAIWLLRLGLEANNWSTESGSLISAMRSVSSSYAGLVGPLALTAAGDLRGFNYGYYGVTTVNGAPAWTLRAAYSKVFNTPAFRAVQARTLSGKTANAPATATIGALLNLTGSIGEIGLGVQAALEEAVEAVNDHLAQNGYLAPNGQPPVFNLKVVDVGGATSALAGLQKLNAEGIKVVIGPMLSSDCAAVLSYAADNGMTLLAPSSTDVSLAKADALYRFVPPNSRQSEALTAYATGKGIKTLVTLASDDSWGRSARADIESAFASAAAGRVAPQGALYDPAAATHPSALAALDAAVGTALSTRAPSEVAVFAITLGEGVGLLKEAANSALYPNLSKVDWYCADGLTKLASLTTDPQAAAFAVARNLTGPVYDIMATHPGATPTPLPRQIIVDKVSKRLGEEAYPYAYVAWDAFQCAAEALMLSDWKSTADPFAGNLVTVANSYIGLNGFLSLDGNGDQANGHYAFYKLASSGAGYAWNRQTTYHFHPNGTTSSPTPWFTTP